MFGTLEDADRLIAAAHERGIRVVLDSVPNHTSSDHPWFLDALTSRRAAHRDWYLWRDLPGRRPPQRPRGPVRRVGLVAGRGHRPVLVSLLPPGQPELDWRNPAVRAAMLDNLRFWLDRGVDGFRIDVLWLLAKDDTPWPDRSVTDAPSGFGLDPRNALEHGDGPAMDERLRELRAVADEYAGPGADRGGLHGASRLVRYYGPGGRGAHLPFNTGLVIGPWEAGPVGPRSRPARPRSRARVAELGPRQPRPVAGRDAARCGAGSGCGDAVAHAARHADAVLRRRAGAAGRARAAGTGGGRRWARPGALADALDHGPRRFHGGPPVAADHRRSRDVRRRGAGARPTVDAGAPPRAAGAPARRARAPPGLVAGARCAGRRAGVRPRARGHAVRGGAQPLPVRRCS